MHAFSVIFLQRGMLAIAGLLVNCILSNFLTIWYDVFVIMQGIPSLVILDENDEVITTDGRSVIAKDVEGKVSDKLIFLCFGCIPLLLLHKCG